MRKECNSFAAPLMLTHFIFRFSLRFLGDYNTIQSSYQRIINQQRRKSDDKRRGKIPQGDT